MKIKNKNLNLREYLKVMFKFKIKSKTKKELTELKEKICYLGMEDLLLQKGKEYKSQKLTEKERDCVLKIVKKHRIGCRPKECFKNSQEMALFSHGKIKYVEGMAVSLIPTIHAWNEINGKVIDVTWVMDDEKIDKISFEDLLSGRKECSKNNIDNIILGKFKDKEYIGVVIPSKYVGQKCMKDGEYHSLIDDWNNGHPLLKREWEWN